jgi:hypothetical protein
MRRIVLLGAHRRALHSPPPTRHGASALASVARAGLPIWLVLERADG